MKKKLYDNIPVIGKLSFKMIDLIVCLAQLLLRNCFVDFIFKHPAVPTAVKNRNPSTFRSFIPVAPQKRAHDLFFALSSMSEIHSETSRIERKYQPVYQRAFACTIPSFKNDHYRDL